MSGAFQRLALLTAWMAVAGGLAAVGYWLAWEVAVAALAGGFGLAAVGTLELDRRPGQRRAQRAGEVRRVGRAVIERRARESRPDDDDDAYFED